MGLFSVPGLSDAVGPNPLITTFPAVNTFTIASLTMPGKWTLTNAPKLFGWQIQQGFGLSGAVVFPKGDPLVVAKFRGEIWEQADWTLYLQIRKQILVKPVFGLGGFLLTAAMGIDHPELKALGVESVVMLETEAAVQEGPGLWVVGHTFLQYRAPLKAPAKPKVVIPDVAPPVPTAQSQYEIEAQKMAAEIAAKKAALAL